MNRFLFSHKHSAFFIVSLLVTTKFAASLQESEDEIDESETDDWEEEDPQEPVYKVPEGVQTLSFHPANLTDEDQHAPHMPKELKCDGCTVVAYVMTQELEKIQGRYKKGHKLKESELVDLFDVLCADKKEAFNDYGVKEIEGVKRLSGPGLKTKDAPGVMSGGGRWPFRLQTMCMEYVGELGEEEIYDHFLSGGPLKNFLCRNKALGHHCPPKKRIKKKGKKDTASTKDEL